MRIIITMVILYYVLFFFLENNFHFPGAKFFLNKVKYSKSSMFSKFTKCNFVEPFGMSCYVNEKVYISAYPLRKMKTRRKYTNYDVHIGELQYFNRTTRIIITHGSIYRSNWKSSGYAPSIYLYLYFPQWTTCKRKYWV